MAKELNPKQDQYQALWALRQIGLRIGMYPLTKSDIPTRAEMERRKDMVGRDYLGSCFLWAVSENCPPIARAAFCAILDFAAYGWREQLSPSLLGHIVDRDAPEVRQWRLDVLRRDGYKCTKCNSTANLHAHHIARWADVPELRVDIDNGLTLCKVCHEDEHRITHS